jgi:hypothetical protein
MRTSRRGIAAALLTVLAAWGPTLAHAGSFEESSASRRALYTAGAVAANVVPGVASVVEPKCLPGYFFCKLTFAAGSVLFAGENFVMSGGADTEQSRAILYRGFAGDWFVTPRNIAGDTKPQVLPEPPPAAGENKPGEGFVPPPR